MMAPNMFESIRTRNAAWQTFSAPMRPPSSIASSTSSPIWGATKTSPAIPAYPVTDDAGKTSHAPAKAKNEFGYGAQWTGHTGALAREMPAAERMALLQEELRESIAGLQRYA